MGVAETVQLGLSLLACVALAALYFEVRAARRRGEALPGDLRAAIEAASRAQIEHRDELMLRTIGALRTVMHDTSPRTVVVGVREPEDEGEHESEDEGEHESEDEGEREEDEDAGRDTTPEGEGEEDGDDDEASPTAPKKRRH